MIYSFQKPGKIRMDIKKPSKGAALIYNPEISPKVQVRPFPKISRFVLHYNLTDKRVSSDSGGTIDRSDIGHRIEVFCGKLGKSDSKPKETGGEISVDFRAERGGTERWTFEKDGLLKKIESFDDGGALTEIFEWNELKINQPLNPELFKKF